MRRGEGGREGLGKSADWVWVGLRARGENRDAKSRMRCPLQIFLHYKCRNWESKDHKIWGLEWCWEIISLFKETLLFKESKIKWHEGCFREWREVNLDTWVSLVHSFFYSRNHHRVLLLCMTLFKALGILPNERQNSCPYDTYILVGKPVNNILGGEACDGEKQKFSDCPGDAVGKNLPAIAGTQVWSLVRDNSTYLGATKPVPTATGLVHCNY